MEVSLGGADHGAHAASHSSHVDDDRKVRIGMFFYVICDAMFALFMVSAYVFYRAENVNGLWALPKGTRHIDPAMTNTLLGILLASALCFAVAHISIRNGNLSVARIGIVLATVLWVVSLVMNINYMGHLPFTQTKGGFAAMYMLFLGYHIYHLIFGLMFAIGIAVRTVQGRYTAERHLGFTTIGYYWYWTAIFAVIAGLLPLLLP